VPIDTNHRLFGALTSPIDSIAVLGILNQAGAPKALDIKITGESLFNDGIGVVVCSSPSLTSRLARPFSPGTVRILT
jgi:hypothetical protein